VNAEQMWVRACKTLITESGCCVSDMPIQDHLKEIFVEAVELHQLSFEASTSFLYSLYYFGQLSLIDLLLLENEQPISIDFSTFDAVLDAQKQWAERASDYQKLIVVSTPLHSVTDDLLHKFSTF
jgi:hypothetical protein